MKKYPTRLFLLTGGLFFISCAKNVFFVRNDYLADTFVEIKIIPEQNQPVEQIVNGVLKTMKTTADKFDIFSSQSEISKINRRQSPDKIPVSPDISSVLKIAQQLAEESSGNFDATVYPLTILWNFPKRKTPPQPAEIREKQTKVNFRHLKINKNFLIKSPEIKIDLNGIAKGYMVDIGVRYLQENGIKTGLINAGGNIRCFGNRVFNIGIRHPRKLNDILTVVKLKNQSIATSGDYENYFTYQGRRYHHLLNPHTGYPADKCISVTIIAENATIADGLSTAVFVVGPEKCLKLLEKFPGTAGLIITADGRIITSKNWPGRKNLPTRIKTEN